MKSKISRVIPFVALFLSCGLFAQTADEIIARHIEAHGGAAAWSKVEAVRVTGKFTAFSLENDYTAYKTKAGSYYADFYLGEKRVIESIHENEGWTIDPWQEMDYARRLNDGEMNAFMQKAEFITPFLDYHEKGHSVDYPGLDTIDGMVMHTLKLTRPNGRIETWHLNADTYLEYKCEADWVDFAMNVPAETYFDDFQEVDGLVFPFFVERTFWQRDRILLVEDIGINPEIDPAMFIMPRRAEMEELSFLQGHWDVTVEVMTRRGTWYPMDSTTSIIEFVAQNMLQERITYERVFLISRSRSYTYNEAGKNFRVAEYDDLTTTLSLFEGVLSDTAFVFDDAGIRYGDPEPEGRTLTQYVAGQITVDGFVLERNVSTDAGETWQPRDRFTYKRQRE
jgi:hypothetical protein